MNWIFIRPKNRSCEDNGVKQVPNEIEMTGLIKYLRGHMILWKVPHLSLFLIEAAKSAGPGKFFVNNHQILFSDVTLCKTQLHIFIHALQQCFES